MLQVRPGAFFCGRDQGPSSVILGMTHRTPQSLLSVSEIRSYLTSGDKELQGAAVRSLLDVSEERQAYRVALAYLPGLTREDWADMLRNAGEGAEASESPRITDLDVGSAEPFCACGRRISQCDHSRKGCHR